MGTHDPDATAWTRRTSAASASRTIRATSRAPATSWPHAARRRSRRSTASTSRPARTSSRPTPSTPRRSRSPTTTSSRTSTRSTWPRRRSAAAPRTTFSTPEKPRFVAGALGPTNRTASLSPDVNNPGFRGVTFDELVDAYYEQARGLVDGGVDILLPETTFDTLNLKAALFAIEKYFDDTGITPAGHRLDHDHRRLGPHALRPDRRGVLELDLARAAARRRHQLRPRRGRDARRTSRSCRALAPIFISCYPNAGLPNALGGYDETPDDDGRRPARLRRERLAEHRRRLLRHGARAHPRDRRDRARRCRRACRGRSSRICD